MSLLFRHHCPHESERLDAAFAGVIQAQARVAEAATGVQKASDHARARMEAERERIRQRIASQEQSRPEPSTTDTRRAVEGMLADMEAHRSKGRAQ